MADWRVPSSSIPAFRLSSPSSGSFGFVRGAGGGSGRSEPEFWPSVGPYQVYDEFLYDLMSAETERLERYRERLESMGKRVTVTTGGVGGFQELPALRLPRVALTIASGGTNLQNVDVYTRPIRAPEENYLFCNVGLDVLHEFSAYVINFRDMALVLE